MNTCFIAFGGNLGAVVAQFRFALQKIDEFPECRVVAWSRLFRTTPIGSRSGTAYFNAAVQVETSLAPVDVLNRLQRIEEEAGRRRNVHWGPRILDLDLISYEQEVVDTAQLTLPHPHCWYRRFVLDPWRDLAPDSIHPQLQESVTAMRERLLVRPLPVAIKGFDSDGAVRRRVSGITTVKLIDNASTVPAITFALSEGPHEMRTVDLWGITDPCDFAEQVIRAALDEPVPLMTLGEPWAVDE